MLFKKKDREVKPCRIESLYEEHCIQLYWAAFQTLHDNHLAEDAMQETFERVLRNKHSLDLENPEKVGALLYVICKNIATDIIRKKSKERLSAFPEKELEISEYTYNPEKIIISRESLTETEKIIEKLDIKYKSVLLLSTEHDLTLEDVSNLLEISFETAKKRLYRARIMVKQELAKLNAAKEKQAEEIYAERTERI